MSYQVFARKYRPKTFDDIVGQQHIVRTLKNAIEQKRLAHAYLFVGPRGTGKTSTARIIAKALNCSGGPRVDFDPDEDVCIEIAEGRSMDVLEIDGASNNGVEQIRELRENVRFAPSRGQFKIYIIDEVHMLTPGAFNALLKTLEEPPEHVKFIFATTEPQKVLPTILSRCQRFDLQRIPAKLIADHLQFIADKEKIVLSDEAAAAIAKGADGGLRDAESMLDQLVAFCGDTITETDVLSVFGFTARAVVAELCSRLLACDTAGALSLLGAQAEEGKDLLKLLADLVAHLRNLLVYAADPNALADELSSEEKQLMIEQAAMQPFGKIIALIDDLAEAEGRMKWAPNKRLHFEIAVIKSVQMLNSASLDEVIESLAALREGRNPEPPARRAQPAPATTAVKVAAPKATPQTPPPPVGEKSLSQMAAEAVAAAKAAEMQTQPPAQNKSASQSSSAQADPPASSSARTSTISKAEPTHPKSSAIALADDDDEDESDSLPDSHDPVKDLPADDLEPPLGRDEEADAPKPSAAGEFPRESWVALVHSLRDEPFVHACLLRSEPVGIEDGKLIIGFPPEEKVQASMLEDDKRRKHVETRLAAIHGSPLGITTRVIEGLIVDPVPADRLPFEKDPLNDFFKDPLINKALEYFRGQLDASASG